jgi:2-hydroxychromene-2-carboxylate isomerase
VTSTTRPTVEFFFCFSCPWSYLALTRLEEAALRTGAHIVYRPIISAWIDDGEGSPVGTLFDSEDPRAVAYARKDLLDWARFCGVQIDLPPGGPIVPEWAQRGAVLAIEAGVIRQYAIAMYRAYFGRGRDIAERATVLAIAGDCGFSGEAFEARLGSNEVLAAIRHNTEVLWQRGGFASPTMFRGDDMYFGHDRVSLLEGALMRAADRPFIAPGEHGR